MCEEEKKYGLRFNERIVSDSQCYLRNLQHSFDLNEISTERAKPILVSTLWFALPPPCGWWLDEKVDTVTFAIF